MKRIKIIVLLAVLLAGLSVSGMALAQSSGNFDLGCWGVVTTAGGTQQTANFRLTYALGQLSAGGASSPNYALSIGYLQDWRKLQPGPGPIITPDPNAVATLYLPIISHSVKLIRKCS